ncbi:hypothetical protein VPHF86_0054 [Vibrio phage F86]
MHTPISKTGELLGSMRAIVIDERIESALRFDLTNDQEIKQRMINSRKATLGEIQDQQNKINLKLKLLHQLLDLKGAIL